MAHLRVLVVDNQAMAVRELRSLMAAAADIEVVADVPDWWTALKVIHEQPVDVCVLDVSRPELNGAVAAGRLRHAAPGLRVVVLADDHDLHRLEQLLLAGINAYLLKRTTDTELVPAIRAVADAGVYLGAATRGT